MCWAFLPQRRILTGRWSAKFFYKEKDIDRIVEYCERDVVAIAQVILKLRQENLLSDTEITSIE